MKKSNLMLAIGLTAVSSIGLIDKPIRAAVVTHFNDTFDTRSLGDLPSDGDAPKWIYPGATAAHSYTIVSDPSPDATSDPNAAPDYALFALRTTTSTYVYTSANPSVSLDHQTVAHISFDLNQPNKYNDTSNTGMFVTIDSGSSTHSAGAVQISGGGALSYYTWSEGTRTGHTTAQTIVQGKWTHFNFDIQYDSVQAHYVYTLTVDTTPLASGQLASDMLDGSNLRLFFSPQGNNSATYIDNVLITTEPVPEPMLSGLMTLMIGGLVARRRGI